MKKFFWDTDNNWAPFTAWLMTFAMSTLAYGLGAGVMWAPPAEQYGSIVSVGAIAIPAFVMLAILFFVGWKLDKRVQGFKNDAFGRTVAWTLTRVGALVVAASWIFFWAAFSTIWIVDRGSRFGHDFIYGDGWGQLMQEAFYYGGIAWLIGILFVASPLIPGVISGFKSVIVRWERLEATRAERKRTMSLSERDQLIARRDRVMREAVAEVAEIDVQLNGKQLRVDESIFRTPGGQSDAQRVAQELNEHLRDAQATREQLAADEAATQSAYATN